MKLPYTDVEFDDKGALVHPDQLKELDDLLADKRPTDVLVMSHGWNSTHGESRVLYERLIASIVAVRPKVNGADDRRFVVVGALWPAIQWAPDENSGAGAGAGDEVSLLQDEIGAQIADPEIRRRLVELAPQLEGSSAAQEEFLELLRSTLPGTTKGEDEAAFDALKEASPEEVFAAAKGGAESDAAPAAAGGAAGIDPAGLAPLADGGGAGFFDSIVNGARNLVNVTTYYTMKERAGVVGRKGISKVIERVHKSAPSARVHLIGHSFGGRAVTAAALATSAPVSSLTLLQAAYSHFGMATSWDGAGKDGIFAEVPAKIDGPIVVTFTRNDKALGLAYPIASRLARQIGVSLGDENDPYGGIGRNGALKTRGAVAGKLLDVGGAYSFAPHKVYSLNADSFIEGHAFVTGRQVGYALLSAIIS